MKIRRQINPETIMRRIRELEALTYVGDAPFMTFVTFLPNGNIYVNEQFLNGKFKLAKENTQMFSSGPELFDYLEGRTEQHPVIIDSFAMLPDTFYVDHSLFFCMDQEELAHLSSIAASETLYMAFYLDMARKYTFDGELPKNSLLSDLRGCCDQLSVEQLVERYSDHKWFKKVSDYA